MILEPNVETLPWAEQIRLDDVAYRKQLKYLFTHSPFYCEKLGRAGHKLQVGLGTLGEAYDARAARRRS